QNDHTAAVVSYRQAISLGSANASTFTRLGLSLLALGDENGAVTVLKKALELDPGNEDVEQALRKMGVL
ncbi:MAG TPA: tetratricopeptide repeat protein, partial [Verrucomicrobiales bacterium]|nr:tetratricopeptide repeat protein [Verrucomicrobiales bacterium]